MLSRFSVVREFNICRVMLTEQMKNFQIVRANREELIYQNTCTGSKIIYREFEEVSPQQERQICALANISHPHLLHVFKVEKRISAPSGPATGQNTSALGVQH